MYTLLYINERKKSNGTRKIWNDPKLVFGIVLTIVHLTQTHLLTLEKKYINDPYT